MRFNPTKTGPSGLCRCLMLLPQDAAFLAMNAIVETIFTTHLAYKLQLSCNDPIEFRLTYMQGISTLPWKFSTANCFGMLLAKVVFTMDWKKLLVFGLHEWSHCADVSWYQHDDIDVLN